MPKIKKYVCQCVYCMYPFGPGAPVCVRERLVNKDSNAPLYQCTEKGCKHYETLLSDKDKKEK